MNRLGLVLILPLAACASVEERTAARSGPGFSNETITGATAPGPERREITMQGLAAVPVTTVAGAQTLDDAAGIALAQGGASAGAWAADTIGTATYALRQLRVGAADFAVFDPQGDGAAPAAVLTTRAAVRTGCKATGRSWSAEGRTAVALDCS